MQIVRQEHRSRRSIGAGGNKGSGPGGHPPLLFLEQTEARRAIKNLGETGSPYLSKGLDDRAPPLISRSGPGIEEFAAITFKP